MEKGILDSLLDKYEKSRLASGEPRVRRRVSLKTAALPAYHAREIEYRKAFHLAADHLERQGLLQIEWVPGEQGNLIKALHLDLARLPEAYRSAGRTPQSDVLADLARELSALNPKTIWLQAFVRDCLGEIDARRYPAQLPRDERKLGWLMDSFRGIEDKEADELLERIFSKRYLGHSKLFEQQVRTRLLGILRRYASLPELDEEDLLLLEAGLVRAAGEVLIRGPLQLRLPGGIADLAPFSFGVGLGAETLSTLEISGCSACRVVSVENKATFRELIRAGLDEKVLLICLGGFAGSSKRRLLTKLQEYLGDQVRYGHWGDLDYGGLQIFRHLRQTCLTQLEPLLMDAATYEAYVEIGEPFAPAYGQRLQGLHGEANLAEFREVLEAMLRRGKTLEQEAVPVERLIDLLQ